VAVSCALRVDASTLMSSLVIIMDRLVQALAGLRRRVGLGSCGDRALAHLRFMTFGLEWFSFLS
jgi:hypothetical protein